MVVLHRTNQGGSVVNFVIIGIILVLAVASVGYVVIKRGERARKDIAIATIEEQTKNSQDKTNTETSKPEVTKQASDEKTKTPTQPSAVQPEPSKTLPATGPEQTVGELVALGLIMFAITSYVASRRELSRSL